MPNHPKPALHRHKVAFYDVPTDEFNMSLIFLDVPTDPMYLQLRPICFSRLSRTLEIGTRPPRIAECMGRGGRSTARGIRNRLRNAGELRNVRLRKVERQTILRISPNPGSVHVPQDRT